MPIQTTSNLSNSIRVQYIEEYEKGAGERRVYDQLSKAIGKDLKNLARGSSISVPFVSAANPATAAISELVDVVPETVRDAVATLTPTSRGKLFQFSELLDIQNYTGFGQAIMEINGDNMMASVDLLAQAAALQGSLVSRAVARTSLSASEVTHNLNAARMSLCQSLLQSLKCPGIVGPNGGKSWVCIMHPDAFYDFRTQNPILTIGEYVKPEIALNEEIGSYNMFRLIVTPFAKVFNCAGLVSATAVSTTLAANANALATTMVTADDVSANIAVGRMWAVGTEETGDTHYPTNERFYVKSAATVTLTIVGEGVNGGLKYDHLLGETVRNDDHVYPVVFGSGASLAKVYDIETGQYGTIVGPNTEGGLEQWTQVGWKWYGGYGRLSENWLVRAEVSSSLDT